MEGCHKHPVGEMRALFVFKARFWAVNLLVLAWGGTCVRCYRKAFYGVWKRVINLR